MAMLRRWGPILVVIALMAGAYLLGLGELVNLSNLIKQREALGQFVSENLIYAALLYFALYVLMTAISFPGASALSISAGLIFGWVLAGTLTVFSATIGATIVFWVAQTSFGDTLKDKAGPMLGKMIEGFKDNGFQYLLTLRLVPIFPFWAVNIVPGLLSMRTVPYVAATFIGIIPGTFAFSYLGSGLDSVIAEQEKVNPGCASEGTCAIEPSALVTKELLLALFFLGALSLVPIVLKNLRGRSASTHPS